MPGTASPARRVVFLHDADVVPGLVGALRPLSESVDLWVPRHPGFGEFDEVCEDWDSVSDLAMWHLSRLDAEVAGPVHLIGAGFGGWVALEMGVRRPDRFASLTLVSPFGVKLSGRDETDFADLLLLDPEELLELGWADSSRATGIRMPGYPPDEDDEADARSFADRAALARYGWRPFMYDPRLARWLGVLTMPRLVIAGDSDRMLAPGHSRRLADRIGAEFVDLADCGHFPYLEQPDAFYSAVLGFLSAHDEVGKGDAA